MYKTEFRFLTSSKDKSIFLAHYSPQDSNLTAGAVILIPPFAEEMNRSKRMYVLTARQLANAGFHVFCFDLVGTGDSECEFQDCSYVDWSQNIKDVYAHVTKSHSCSVHFIALRFGALLLADFLRENSENVKTCIFWDPVESGEVFFRQLIRTKLAADMAIGSEKKTSEELMVELSDQGYLEIGGYAINQPLAEKIQQLKLVEFIPNMLGHVELYWMQTNPNAGKIKTPALPNSLKNITSDKVSFHTVEDIRFWMQQEVTIAPNLLRETCKVLAHDEILH